MRLKQARSEGLIPEKLYGRITERFGLAVSGIDRIERASGLAFPAAYVEPSLVVTSPDPGSYEYGILFARTIPVEAAGRMAVVVQVSAPLLAFGLKGTIHAILAHEFLHYLELMWRVSRMGVLSDEVTGSLFESSYADGERLLEPRAVFADRTLVDHITRRFPAGFRDARLEEKAVSLWHRKGLPRTDVDLGSNTVRLSAESLSRMSLDPGLAGRLAELAEKSGRIRARARRLY